jgi:glucose-1-phosphate thymidylyltransferase
MQVYVFEDRHVDQLAPCTTLRPACDLTIGGFTLCDALAHLGHVRRVVRPHLARYVAAVADSRVALWGRPIVPPADEPPASRHGETALVVNARVVPSRATVQALRSLVEAGHRGIVRDGAAMAAAILHRAADGTSADDTALASLAATGSPDAIAALALTPLDCSLELLHLPQDIIGAHEHAIAGGLAMLIDSGLFREVRPGLFAAEDARIADQVVVRHGPVVVGPAADIGPFVCFDGPAFVGEQARVNPHTWIGGEIEASVLEPYANKPHAGFLGHSHVGSWANIAAGTVTSNLKATYGIVRLHEAGRTIDTGRQFMGALIGDLAKTAINTSLPCGARIGVAATVGGVVPERVPALHNQLVGGPDGSTSTVEQVATIVERMMARRGLALLPADRELVASLA